MRASVVFAALGLLLSSCSAADLSRICENAGGRYTAAGCDNSTPAKQAAKERCETQGGVYLAGQDYCAIGGGGP